MLNIIGGLKKRTKLVVPTKNVRPTSSKKREAIFSILESNALKNKTDFYSNGYFLDLFAGSGSLGLEAISRGAKFCYFYEINKDIVKIIEEVEKTTKTFSLNNNPSKTYPNFMHFYWFLRITLAHCKTGSVYMNCMHKDGSIL